MKMLQGRIKWKHMSSIKQAKEDYQRLKMERIDNLLRALRTDSLIWSDSDGQTGLQGFLMNGLQETKIFSKSLDTHDRLHFKMSKEIDTLSTH